MLNPDLDLDFPIRAFKVDLELTRGKTACDAATEAVEKAREALKRADETLVEARKAFAEVLRHKNELLKEAQHNGRIPDWGEIRELLKPFYRANRKFLELAATQTEQAVDNQAAPESASPTSTESDEAATGEATHGLTTGENTEVATPKKRGRPPGSKNKPKVATREQDIHAGAPTGQATAEAPENDAAESDAAPTSVDELMAGVTSVTDPQDPALGNALEVNLEDSRETVQTDGATEPVALESMNDAGAEPPAFLAPRPAQTVPPSAVPPPVRTGNDSLGGIF